MEKSIKNSILLKPILSLKKRIYKAKFKNGNARVRRHYSKISDPSCNVPQFNKQFDFINHFTYIDETCPEIYKMFSLDASQSNRNKYIVNKDSNEIEISSQQSNGENWLVFLIEDLAENYTLEFDYLPRYNICEFQLAFNYRDLKNRNRFIIMENEYAIFDCIKNGLFFEPLFKTPCRNIIKTGEVNHVRLIVNEKQYAFFVNDVQVLSVIERKKMCKGNGLAIVLWEDHHNRMISTTISNIRVFVK